MPDDLTVLVPRKDLADERWNRIQDYTRAAMGNTPYVTGTYDQGDEPHWSMSRALNAARKQATTPKLLLVPCDYILTPDVLDQVSRMIDTFPWWGPFAHVLQVTQRETDAIFTGTKPVVTMKGVRTPACMACTAIRANVFDAVEGMDERFTGYAPEDAALRDKLSVLYPNNPPPRPRPEMVIELFTDRSARPNFDVTGPLYQREYRDVHSAEEMRRTIERARNRSLAP